jgi:hypothetical protein
MLRYLYQNIILEQSLDIVSGSQQTWTVLLQQIDPEILHTAITPFVPPFALGICARPNQPITDRALISPTSTNPVLVSSKASAQTGKKRPDSKPIDHGSDTDDRAILTEARVIALQSKGSQALGQLAARLPVHTHEFIYETMLELFRLPTAANQLVVGLFFSEWARGYQHFPAPDGSTTPPAALNATLNQFFCQVIDASEADFNVWIELEALKTDLRAASRVLLSSYQRAGISVDTIASLDTPLDEWETASKLLAVDDPKARNNADSKDLLQQKFDIATSVRTKHVNRVASVVSEALLRWNAAPKNPKSIIVALQRSIKNESNCVLQKRCCEPLVRLLHQMHTKVGKIVDNFCKYVCTDAADTLNQLQQQSVYVQPSSTSSSFSSSSAGCEAETEVLTRGRVTYRGACMAIGEMCVVAGSTLFEVFPALHAKSFEILKSMAAEDSADVNSEQLVDALLIFEAVSRQLHPDLTNRVFALLPNLKLCLSHELELVRTGAAVCLSSICSKHLVSTMEFFITEIVSDLSSGSDTFRIGAMTALQLIVNQQQIRLLAYLVFLVNPVLARMSDNSLAIRHISAQVFAHIVQLLPLEASAPNPEGMSMELSQRRKKEREFLDQLIDGSKMRPFELPITVNATLRKYQQEGVNWMMFLNKYNLNGILCDDMGLGKTLQTLCVIAADHHTKNPAHPSLIVCPPTLISHWFVTILNYYFLFHELFSSTRLIEKIYIFVPAVARAGRWNAKSLSAMY